MELDKLKKEIMGSFPNVENSRVFFMKQSIFLEEKYRFVPENTHFAEGGCSDEINGPEYLLMEQYWGSRFKFGGLAGYPHGGRTGFEAVSHHVPEVFGRKNLLFVTGPHIGYHRGEWGKVSRTNQDELSNACGSLAAALESDFDENCEKAPDPLDRQQQIIEMIMFPYLKKCSDSGKTPKLLDATNFLMQKINEDVLTVVNNLSPRFQGQIALLTGITINTELGNFFSPSLVEIMGEPKLE
ncbi:MAG: hypothetical protein HQM13_18430 [SAR324 cluster bacterium]|nr:hypothetical protein [SAR324 cluster bacterium]